jgi:hypothetical protein
MTKQSSVLWREAYLGFYVGECLIFQNYLVMGRLNGFFGEEKKSNQVAN